METEPFKLRGGVKIIRNGGLEQALLEIANEDGLLTDKDKDRLDRLKTLNPNRVETCDETIIGIIKNA